jgi:nucleotidyltransferase substrate binding protein (TIGR01987 family)
MATDADVRWKQRFANFEKAFDRLGEAVARFRQTTDAAALDVLRESLIQRFEYTHELAWKTCKDYAEFQGNNDIAGSRDATREAFAMRLIADGATWMEMIASRNLTSHTYEEERAADIAEKICDDYYPAFQQFAGKMRELRGMTAYGLPVATLAALKDIFRAQPAIEKVALYGSRAKGSFKPYSDIDLALLGDGISTETVAEIARQIDDLLLPYKVDLTLYAALKSADLRDHIDRVGKEIYRREEK